MTGSLKRSCAILLCLAMIPTLFACRSAEPTLLPSSSPTTEEMVTIDFFVNNGTDIETAFSMSILEELGKRTNTKIKIVQPPANGFSERLQLLFASGDKLPCVIGGVGINDPLFESIKKDKRIIPVTKYFEQSPNLKKEIQESTITGFKRDGELWHLPTLQGFLSVPGIFLRLDWLNALGYKFPLDKRTLTTDELLTIASDFTFKDPDQNGKNDTYGFIQPAGGFKSMVPEMILNAFGAGMGWQKDSSGQLVDSDLTFNWEKYKKAIAYYKQLFEKKVVEPEILLLQPEQVRDKLYKGSVGAIYNLGNVGSGVGFMDGIRKTDPDGILLWINNLKGPEGYSDRYGSGFSSRGFVVSADCKYPDRVAKLFDYALSPEGFHLVNAGIQGVHYERYEDEVYIRTPAQLEMYTANQNSKPEAWAFRKQQNVGKDLAARLLKAGFPQNYSDMFRIWRDDWMYDIKPDLFYGYAPKKEQKLLDLEKEWETVISKYLLGQANEKDLDNIKDKYLNSGYIVYMNEMNKWYQENVGK